MKNLKFLIPISAFIAIAALCWWALEFITNTLVNTWWFGIAAAAVAGLLALRRISPTMREVWENYHLGEWLLLGATSALMTVMFWNFLAPENQNEYYNLILMALGVFGILVLAIRATWEKSLLRKGLMFLLFVGIMWQGTQFVGLAPQNIGKADIRKKVWELWEYIENAPTASPQNPVFAFHTRLRGLEIGERATIEIALGAQKPSEWFFLEERVGSELHRRNWWVNTLDCPLQDCVITVKTLRDGTMVRALFREVNGKLWGGDHDPVTEKISFVATEPTRLVVTLTRKS